jgi:hypothetical protein
MIRIVLPAHLKTLINQNHEVVLNVEGLVTQRSLLNALETRFPVLTGTIRDPTTQRRRPFVRFFACELDLSHGSADEVLPAEVVSGAEAFYVVGAMAGG